MTHTYSEIQTRLKRANGHLNKIISMIEDDCACLDIAQQLQAVEKAVHNAKVLLVQDHIEHCIENAAHTKSGVDRKALSELKQITKYL